MDLSEVGGLIALAEAGSIKGAAARLGISRATLRRRIRALERRLGVALTSVGESRVELTEAGVLCVEEGRFLVRQAEDLKALLRAKGTQPSGCVRIATPIGSAGPELAIGLRHFAASYPELRFELWFTADPVAELTSGADVAVLFGPYPIGDWKVSSLGQLHLGAFAHPDYLAQAGPIHTLDDLSRHRLLHATSVPIPPLVWPRCAGGTVPVEPWLTTTDMDVVRQAVVARLGVGLVLSDVAGNELEQVLPKIVGMNIPVWALTTPVGAKLPRVRAFVDGARAYMMLA